MELLTTNEIFNILMEDNTTKNAHLSSKPLAYMLQTIAKNELKIERCTRGGFAINRGDLFEKMVRYHLTKTHLTNLTFSKNDIKGKDVKWCNGYARSTPIDHNATYIVGASRYINKEYVTHIYLVKSNDIGARFTPTMVWDKYPRMVELERLLGL